MRGLPIALLLAALRLPAQNLADFEKRVTEFTLPNGLHFLVVERHEAPVISFNTFVNAGSVNDSAGESGLAHLFERLAFKGTETIGATDWAAEKRALDAVEEVADRLDAERNKGPRADAAKLAGLEAELNVATSRAQSFVVPSQFLRVMQENGGVDMNAVAVYDSSEFRYSLPSNRIELWFLMESQRLLHPVMREFYSAREAALDDYRASVDNNIQGKLVQTLLPAAFTDNPYRNPDLGWEGDLGALRSSRARAFFEKYYVPGNMLMTLVGDVNPAEAKRLAERYFGALPARPLPAPPHAAEPPQPGPKTVWVYSGQSIVIAAFKRPDMYDKDDPVFDVIRLILSNGRTGLLYKQLVEEKRLAQTAQMVTPFPGGRYPNLALFFLSAAPGRTPAEVIDALTDVIAGLQKAQVDPTVLARARAQARVTVLRQLANNAGLASLLAAYQEENGDRRKLFTSLVDLNKVTAADVQRVASQYFVTNGRTMAISEPRPPSPAGTPR